MGQKVSIRSTDDWLENQWSNERRTISLMSFVDGEPKLRQAERCHQVLLQIKVDYPQRGPVLDVKPIEKVLFLLWPNHPIRAPLVTLRHDFPVVPHLISDFMGTPLRHVCLTRRTEADWWCGKTLVDLAQTCREWLCDAAAGLLVKPDDPFEPLFVDVGTPPVEMTTDHAKANALAHDGLWLTKSQLIQVPGTTRSRFLVEKGDVPTQVWYQRIPQASLWTMKPSNVDELLEMFVAVDLDAHRVSYWLNKTPNTVSHLLLIVGVRRPEEVLGRPDSDEWVAFELERMSRDRHRAEWKVTTHPFRDAYTPALARRVSGIKEPLTIRNVLLIGAGALGSIITESLVRTGLVRIRLVDHDTLLPHNLTRHTLTATDIGRAKATAVAERLNSLVEDDTVLVEAVNKNVLNMDQSEWDDLLDGIHAVIDCSASPAVQLRLADVSRDVPVLSTFQVDAGRVTVVLGESRTGIGSVDALEAVMVSEHRELPGVRRWLRYEAHTVMIGGGCRSASAPIPLPWVMDGAGWVATVALEWLRAEDAWPAIEMIGLMTTDPGFVAKVNTSWQQHDVQISNATGGWRVKITKQVEQKLHDRAISAAPLETGGICIGRVDKQRRVAYVIDIWEGPVDSYGSIVGFVRGRQDLKARLAQLESNTGDQLTYIGEWHSHPPGCGTHMSATDSATSRRMAKVLAKDQIPAIFMISNGSMHDTHVVESLETNG